MGSRGPRRVLLSEAKRTAGSVSPLHAAKPPPPPCPGAARPRRSSRGNAKPKRSSRQSAELTRAHIRGGGVFLLNSPVGGVGGIRFPPPSSSFHGSRAGHDPNPSGHRRRERPLPRQRLSKLSLLTSTRATSLQPEKLDAHLVERRCEPRMRRETQHRSPALALLIIAFKRAPPPAPRTASAAIGPGTAPAGVGPRGTALFIATGAWR